MISDNSQPIQRNASPLEHILSTLSLIRLHQPQSTLRLPLAEAEEIDEAIDIEVGEGDEDKFIDIRTDAEKAVEEEEEKADPKEEFGAGLEGSDETGRNMAFQSFNKVENPVIDSYELLSNEDDQELFYDYLIANLKLYFDKMDDELAPAIEEPTNQAYETAKEQEPMGGEEIPVEGEEEVVPALEENVIVWEI